MGLYKAGNKKNTMEIINFAIDETPMKSKKESMKRAKRYISNNWEGIKNLFGEEKYRCSAEGHISHVLSSRLSSRPMGWSLIGADQIARLRVYKANGGDIYELMSKKKKENKKEKRIVELEKRIVKKKIKTALPGSIDNLPCINDGRRTWQRQTLKALRGA